MTPNSRRVTQHLRDTCICIYKEEFPSWMDTRCLCCCIMISKWLFVLNVRFLRFGFRWSNLSPAVTTQSSYTLTAPALLVLCVGLASSSRRYHAAPRHCELSLPATPASWVWVCVSRLPQDCGFGDGGGGGVCVTCEEGRFSSDSGVSPCRRCTGCRLLNRLQRAACAATRDAQCGRCLPGWFTP